jgi:hypothetical protein
MALGLTLYQEHLTIGGTGDVLLVVSIVLMGLATFALGRLAAPSATVGAPDAQPLT